MRFLLLFVFCLYAGVSVAAPAVTPEAKDKTALRPFPTPALSLPDFEKKTVLRSFATPDDLYFKASIRLPRDWIPRGDAQLKNVKSMDRLYGYLAWYDAPGEGNDARPYMTIRSISLDHDITAKAWLVGYMFDNAFNLRALKEHSFSDVEGIYVTYDKLVTYTTWARAVLLGPRVILTELHVPAQTYNRDKDIQIRAMQSYKMTGVDEARIEKLKAFSFLDVATFQYPESWDLFRNIIRSPDFFRVAMFNKPQVESPNTQITVQATRVGGGVSMDLMKEEEQKFLDKYNLIMGEALPAPDFVNQKTGATDIRNFVYKVAKKPGTYEDPEKIQSDREYWVTSFNKGTTAYAISMLVPARMSIYDDWARGTRAYQIIVETISGERMGKKKQEGTLSGETAIPFVR